jgi:hypothetical protein
LNRIAARTLPLCAGLAGVAIAFGAWGASAPEVSVEAPPELAWAAREIEALAPAALAAAQRLTGSEDAARISIALVQEGSRAARAAAPWISGYAIAPDRIVLFPARVNRYPDFGLAALLRHELAHLYVARAAGPAGAGQVPRWFNEGLAMAVGREPGLGDRARVALAVIDDASLPLARLDRAFAGGEAEVHSAYALAGDFVRELLQRHGGESAARILAGVARGERFRDAFHGVTGQTLADFESSYWKRRTLLDRWVPVVSSSVVLWGGIALLALAAIRRRRARDAERLARWGAEEGEAPESELERDDLERDDLEDSWPPRRSRPGS